MQPFSIVSGPAAPLMRRDIDTDVIIRVEHLNRPRSELGQWALEPLRGPGFILDQPNFRGAPILLVGANFGCGSSREHAVWALQGIGIRCVIAPSYGDIFFANCFQNGVLPVTLPEAVVLSVAEQAASGAAVTVDLQHSVVIAPDGTRHAFSLDPIRREMLLEGVDELGLTLRHAPEPREDQTLSPDKLVQSPDNRQPADPAGPTGQLATWLAHFRLEDVPPATRQRARYLLLDGVGCALVGTQLPWSRRAAESVCRLEGTGPAMLIGWNRSLPASAAALLNGTFIQGFEDALGMAGTLSSGLMAAQFGAMSKRMHHGFSARAGVYAAWLAADGYTGIKRVFEEKYGGYLAAFGEGHAPDASQVSKDLGRFWETDQIVVKLHAAMGGLQSPVDAVLAMQKLRPFRPEDIACIDVWVGTAVFHHGAFAIERPLTSVGAQMSLAYTVSVACVDGVAMAKQYGADRINSDEVWRVVPKVHIHLDETFQGSPRKKLGCRLRITFTDGATQEIEQSLRFSEDVANEDIAAKFKTLCESVISPERCSRIEEAVLGLERSADISALLNLLKEEVQPVFGSQTE